MKIENYPLIILFYSYFEALAYPSKNGAYFATCASSKRLQDKKKQL
jgi:hypothetical protein